MTNPFVFGEAVRGKNFIDRKEEIRTLVRDLRDGQKVFLISPRRYGKTSLALVVLEKLRKAGIIPIYMDLQKATTYKHFLESYLGQLLAHSTRMDRLLRTAKELLPTISFDVMVDERGRPRLKLSFGRRDQNLEEAAVSVYETAEKIAVKTRKRLVVAFDEFQDIGRFDGPGVEKTMRSVLQHQRKVGYLFAGSKKHLMEAMIGQESRPFYQSGPVYYLKKIAAETWKSVIASKFSAGKIRIDQEVIEKIIATSYGIPYFVQALCHEIWDHANKRRVVRAEDVDEVIEITITRQQDLYLGIWDKLTAYQRHVLWTIANSGGRNVFSINYIIEHDLVSASSLQKALEPLQKEDLLDREEDHYFLTNVFFREWLKRRIQ